MKSTNKAERSDNDHLLRIPEAAEQIAVSERQVWKLIELGILEAVRIGGATRLRSSDIARLIRDGVDSSKVGPR